MYRKLKLNLFRGTLCVVSCSVSHCNASVKSFTKLSNGYVKIYGGLMYTDDSKNNKSVVSVAPFTVSDHKVTNGEYKEIMNWAKDRGYSDKYEFLIPDYDRFGTSPNKGEIDCSVLTNYFINPVFDNYPVVGITYEQIIEFMRLRSERDNVRYRLLYPEEFDFLVYEVKNFIEDGDVKIIQNSTFDEGSRSKVDMKNDAIRMKNIEIAKNKQGICANKNLQEQDLERYIPMMYYNIQCKGFEIDSQEPFFTSVYKYSPNDFYMYDLIGNTYEITCSNTDLFIGSEVRNYTFMLCGASCFDYYDILIDKGVTKIIDNFNTLRYDRGFRLVIDDGTKLV